MTGIGVTSSSLTGQLQLPGIQHGHFYTVELLYKVEMADHFIPPTNSGIVAPAMKLRKIAPMRPALGH